MYKKLFMVVFLSGSFAVQAMQGGRDKDMCNEYVCACSSFSATCVVACYLLSQHMVSHSDGSGFSWYHDINRATEMRRMQDMLRQAKQKKME